MSEEKKIFDENTNEQIAVTCNRNFVTSKQKKLLITKEDWQEWQANYFSSSILKKALSISFPDFSSHFFQTLFQYDM